VLRAAVPEATIDEDGYTRAHEDNVYLGLDPVGSTQHEVLAEAQTARM
jgi:hypothetical protein